MVVIYNPNAGGGGQDKSSDIGDYLNLRKIQFDIYKTKYVMDAFYYVRDVLNLEDVSALACCGGDGSIHEVTNGMLHRKDKQQVPIAYLPNGSGNDCARSFNLENID